MRKGKFWLGVCLAWAGLAALGVGLAEPSRHLPGVVGRDDRVPLDSGQWPWVAVGRVNQPWGRYCTGALIAADAVLTAAHCLVDRHSGQWLAAHDLVFVAGYRRDWDAGYARGRSILNSGRYVASVTPTVAQVAEDWAVLYLEKPLAVQPLEVRPWSAAMGRPVRLQLAGYGQDRPHLLSMHDGCSVREALPQGRVLLSDCDGTHGDSGSPLLVREGGQVWVAGLLSSIAAADGRPGNYIVDAAAFLPYWQGQRGSAGKAGKP